MREEAREVLAVDAVLQPEGVEGFRGVVEGDEDHRGEPRQEVALAATEEDEGCQEGSLAGEVHLAGGVIRDMSNICFVTLFVRPLEAFRTACMYRRRVRQACRCSQ